MKIGWYFTSMVIGLALGMDTFIGFYALSVTLISLCTSKFPLSSNECDSSICLTFIAGSNSQCQRNEDYEIWKSIFT